MQVGGAREIFRAGCTRNVPVRRWPFNKADASVTPGGSPCHKTVQATKIHPKTTPAVSIIIGKRPCSKLAPCRQAKFRFERYLIAPILGWHSASTLSNCFFASLGLWLGQNSVSERTGFRFFFLQTAHFKPGWVRSICRTHGLYLERKVKGKQFQSFAHSQLYKQRA